MADLAKRLAGGPAGTVAARVARTLIPARPGSCTVLTFHRLRAAGGHLNPGLAGVDPAGFERLVRQIALHATPVGVRDVLTAVRAGRELPDRAVLVTVDDAYRDFARIAWPVLKRHGVPTVLFVPTAHPGDPDRCFWWDRLHAAFELGGVARRQRLGIEGTTALDAFRSVRGRIKSMPHHDAMALVDDWVEQLTDGHPSRATSLVAGAVSDWDELRALAADGVDIAPHSRTHPMLDQLPDDEIDAEVSGSWQDLVAEIPDAVPVFAYPSGGHDPRVRAAVERSELELAFTTERGVALPGRDDPFALPRLNVGAHTSPALVSLQTSVLGRIGRHR